MNGSCPRWIAIVALLLFGAISSTRAQFGQNKVTYHSFQWYVYKSPHFDIYYYPAEEPFLEEVISYAESAYVKISRDLDHELRFRVPLVIYKTHGEFQQTNITLSELPEAVAAFSEPAQNRMVVPIDLPPDELYHLVAHELTHIFQYSLFFDGYLGRALRSNPPAWLIEGMASYLADDEDSLDKMAIRDAVVNNLLPPIESLGAVTFLAYRFGHAIFDFIAEEHGPEGLRSFIYEYRKVLLTNNVEKAIKETFGYDVNTFNRRFAGYLREKYFPVLLENKSPDDYGTEIGIKKPGVFTFSPNISPSGELVAALSSPGYELDLVVLSAEDGSEVKNLTKGWTNSYRSLSSRAFQGRRDLSWSPVADEIAVFARRENKWPLLVFNAITGKRVRDVTIDDIVQCASPVFSADGKRVAFEGNRAGVVDIFEVDLETRAVRNLTQDDFFDANPWYAKDGKTLLYNRRIGSHWKIFSVDLTDPAKKVQLTFGAYDDIQPSLSRDGSILYFSSDRGPYEIFNIHALDLATGEVEQYTSVVGGTFTPAEMADRNGDRQLVFSTYFEGTFRLFRMPLRQPETVAESADGSRETAEAEPFVPALNLRVDETQKSPYRLKWDVEAPYVAVGVANDGTFLTNAGVQFADLLGNSRIDIVASTVSDYSNMAVQYRNLKHRFAWGASAFDYRDYFLRATDSGVDRDQSNRQTGARSFIEYPISRYYRVSAGIGALESSQDLLTGYTITGDPVFTNATDIFGVLNLELIGDTTRFQSFGPFQGKRFNVGVTHLPHLSGDTDGDTTEFRVDFRAYRQATRRSLLAFRAASIYNTGDRDVIYGFGGVNQLRGFDYREFIGARLAWSNLEFRFPLVDRMQFPIMNIMQIRGFLFLDVGAAWFDDDLWWDPQVDRVRVDLTGDPVPFQFWNSDQDELQDGRASYGWGFQFLFLNAMQLNWSWSRRMDYLQYNPFAASFEKVDGESSRMDFYITFDF